MEEIKAPGHNSSCITNEFRMNNEKTETSTSDTVFQTNHFTEMQEIE